MRRHYYISTDLDDLEQIEKDLEAAGVTTPQIHVLSNDDTGEEEHHLHQVEAVLKKDVVHGTERGAVVGVLAAIAVLFIAWVTGINETYTWVPAIFLSVIVLRILHLGRRADWYTGTTRRLRSVSRRFGRRQHTFFLLISTRTRSKY